MTLACAIKSGVARAGLGPAKTPVLTTGKAMPGQLPLGSVRDEIADLARDFGIDIH